MVYQFYCGEWIFIKCSFCGEKELGSYTKYKDGVICEMCEKIICPKENNDKTKNQTR